VNIGQILTEILGREGWPQLTNRPSDHGGLTKGGITFNSYVAWLKAKGRRTILPAEFANLTEDQAKEFMLDSIAGPLMNVAMVDTDLFTVMFDWAEMSGPDAPIRALQEELAERHLVLKADGVYGTRTAASLSAYWDGVDTADQLRLIQGVRNRRMRAYLALVLRDAEVVEFRKNHPSSQLENLQGWLTRAQLV